MPRGLAQALSGVFHPLLVPTYLVAGLLFGAPGLFVWAREARPQVLGTVFLSTFLLPAVGTYALVRTGRVASLLIPNHRERHWPLLLALVGFAAAAGLLYPAEPLLGLVLALQAVAVALTWAISRHWLISAHGVAMGGAVGLVALVSGLVGGTGFGPLVITVGLAGAVGAARLALKAHTPAQVWAGLALGLAVSLLGSGVL